MFYLLSLECIVGGGSWILASAFNALGRPGVIVLRQVIALAVTITLFCAYTDVGFIRFRAGVIAWFLCTYVDVVDICFYYFQDAYAQDAV